MEREGDIQTFSDKGMGTSLLSAPRTQRSGANQVQERQGESKQEKPHERLKQKPENAEPKANDMAQQIEGN